MGDEEKELEEERKAELARQDAKRKLLEEQQLAKMMADKQARA